MAAPIADKVILPLDTGNTGKKNRTQTRVVGADTVHEHFFILGRRNGEFYRLCQQSGLITTIAAGTATAGHIYALRWASTTHAARIAKIAVRRRTIAGFTGAQEVGTAIFRMTGYSASHTAGTAATLTAPNFKKDTLGADTKVTQSMISAAAALTAGTHALDVQPIAADAYAELAAGAAVPKGAIINDLEWTNANGRELTLRQDQGILVRNEILMGAGGTQRLIVEIDWEEVLLADLDL